MRALVSSLWLRVAALVSEDAAVLLVERKRARRLYAQYCAARGR